MNNITVSIIIPYYKQAEFIRDCLNSVIAQTFQSWECIIVNDGSHDNIQEIASKYLKKDSRFKYIEKQNGGLSSARNAGIKISAGKYILPLDADDRIGPDYCTEAVSILEKNKSVKVVYAEAEMFGVQKGLLHLPAYSIFNLSCQNLIYCTAFFRKSDFDKIGGYDEDLRHGLEDWDFWISLLKFGGDVSKINTVQFYYRKKEESMLNEFISDKELQFQAMQHIYYKHEDFFLKHHGSPISVIQKNRALNFQLELLNKNFSNSRKYKLGDLILSPLNLFKILFSGKVISK
jgi:glycosyltransferase involved in cell wall biosynthesis